MTDNSDLCEEAAREARLRHILAREGHALRKDRARSLSLNHQGGYMILDLGHNTIMNGEHFDLTLDDAEAWAAGT
jgi:hypothetical protein